MKYKLNLCRTLGLKVAWEGSFLHWTVILQEAVFRGEQLPW